MSDRLAPEPLIRDLARVLAGALHPGAQLTPGTRLAASRLRDVLGIEDGDPVYGYEQQPGAVNRIYGRLVLALADIWPHYHCATGQENTPCLCPMPATYARQAPNPLEAEL